jgi:hypothetical protein
MYLSHNTYTVVLHWKFECLFADIANTTIKLAITLAVRPELLSV